jgi:hypothetical protein
LAQVIILDRNTLRFQILSPQHVRAFLPSSTSDPSQSASERDILHGAAQALANDVRIPLL